MRFTHLASICLTALTGTSLADGVRPEMVLWGPKGSAGASLVKRATTTTPSTTSSISRVADSACTNGPLTRSCWSSGFSIATDFDAKWPKTGVTRSYTFTITNTTCNPDGAIPGGRVCLLVNGQFPGPTIQANWGDMVSVTFVNQMQHNGTSIHFHGVRQLNTAWDDGTCGITECAVPPGAQRTYTWQATQFGTSWYHSHYSSQYGDGILGGIQINGPAPANYDTDLGTYFLNDWTYLTAFQMSARVNIDLQKRDRGPPMDSILVNGTNKSPSGTGKYGVVTMTKGKKYRLRLINASVDNALRVTLDGHQFQVITADFVPVKPYYANWILIGIGQRYDVIINANQVAGNYWFRAVVETFCASRNNNAAGGLSIFNYAGVAVTDPTTSPTVAKPSDCKEEGPLTPYVSNLVPNATFLAQVGHFDVDVVVANLTTNSQNLVFWGVNLTGINVDWADPTLQYVLDGRTNYPKSLNLVEIPNANTWTYWIIQEEGVIPVPIPHPMHLHGHDFYILGQGVGTFNRNTDPQNLRWDNPMRRDTAHLPAGGWIVLAFPTDNPGAWLLHCHIAWHVDEGLGAQFLESKSTIAAPSPGWSNMCNQWKAYYNSNPAYKKTDSGL